MRKQDKPPPVGAGLFGPAWKWDDRTQTKALIGKLIHDFANPMLAHSESFETTFVETGKEELQSGMGLFLILDQLEERDRARAYRCLYQLVNGTFNVAGYAIIPPDTAIPIDTAVSQVDASKTAMMRGRKAERLAKRDSFVKAAANNRNWRSGSFRENVNKELKAANLVTVGSDRALRRIMTGK